MPGRRISRGMLVRWFTADHRVPSLSHGGELWARQCYVV